MTCYMRHMDWLFDALELESDKDTRKRVDGAIRAELGIAEDAHCPEVWAAVKALEDDARMELIPGVQARLG